MEEESDACEVRAGHCLAALQSWGVRIGEASGSPLALWLIQSGEAWQLSRRVPEQPCLRMGPRRPHAPSAPR